MFENLIAIREILSNTDYDGLSDAEAAALMASPRHQVAVDAWHNYLSLAGRNGIGMDATRRLIQTMDIAAESDPLVNEMRHALRSIEGVNANDPATQAMVQAFAANENLPLTPDDAAAIVGLAVGHESDAQRHSIGAVEAKHIAWARAQ